MGRRAAFQDRKNKGGGQEEVQHMAADVLDIFSHLDDGRPRQIPLDDILVDERVQIRVGGLDEKNLESLIIVLENGGSIDEPILVFEDEQRQKWLSDGFHRVEAFKRAGRTHIMALVRKGGYNEAFRYAFRANLKHGKQLSAEDKFAALRRIYETGDEWAQLSNNQLAQEFGVHPSTIGRWKQDIASIANAIVESKVVGADGRVRDTSNIGKASKRKSDAQQTSLFKEEHRKEVMKVTNWLVSLPNQFDEPTRQQARQHLEYLESVIADLRRMVSQIETDE